MVSVYRCSSRSYSWNAQRGRGGAVWLGESTSRGRGLRQAPRERRCVRVCWCVRETLKRAHITCGPDRAMPPNGRRPGTRTAAAVRAHGTATARHAPGTVGCVGSPLATAADGTNRSAATKTLPRPAPEPARQGRGSDGACFAALHGPAGVAVPQRTRGALGTLWSLHAGVPPPAAPRTNPRWIHADGSGRRPHGPLPRQ